ncbi:uncharacterized protein haspin [Rhinoraja longicauda]
MMDRVQARGGRSCSAVVRTYGKYGSRAVKAHKWLSPDVAPEHLFSSSDSANALHSSRTDTSGESIATARKRRRKRTANLYSVSNAKVRKRKVGNRSNTESQTTGYLLRGRETLCYKDHDSTFTEDESQEDSRFVEEEKKRRPPVSRREPIPTSAQSNFVTYRQKLRHHKVASHKVGNTPLRLRGMGFLGRSVESSESSICFDKSKEFGNSSNASHPNLCPQLVEKLDRAPLQTSTPSCTRRVKIKERSRCIISFSGEIEEDNVWKNSVEPCAKESTNHASVMDICYSQQRRNLPPQKFASTEFSDCSEVVGILEKESDGICGFETDHNHVASVKKFEPVALVASHLFEVQKNDWHQTSQSSYNSNELFSADIEPSQISSMDSLLQGTNDLKVHVRNPLTRSGLFDSTLNLDSVIKKDGHKCENRASNLNFQPVVRLDYFSVQNYLHKSRSLTSEDESSKASSFQDTAGNKEEIINNLQLKFIPPKGLVKSSIRPAHRPMLLCRLERQQHLPQKGSLIRNGLKACPCDGALDDYKCKFQLLDKKCKYTNNRSLKSSPPTVDLNLQVDQLSGDSFVPNEPKKRPIIDTDNLEHVIAQQNLKTFSKENGCQMKTNGLSGQMNIKNASKILSEQSTHTRSIINKNIKLISATVKSAEECTSDVLEHSLLQTTEKRNLQSTFMNSSPVFTPLGLRNWSRFKAAHSLHKRKKVITPLKLDQSILGLASPLQKINSCDRSYLLAHQDRLILMENVSATPICKSIRRSKPLRCSLMEQFSSELLQSVIRTDEKIYHECHQNGPISFKECIPSDILRKCKKIGEGVFGEVFQTINNDGNDVAFKIIQIEGEKYVNGEPQKKFEEILPEIIISKKLSQLHEEIENFTFGFISLYSVHCVKDSYPPELLKAWDKYKRMKTSENDRPDEFQNEQLYIIFEFDYGGCDLESMATKVPSLEEARSILHQVTASLAVAEISFHFEHRDLHWGNILVKKTAIKQVQYRLCGNTYNINTHGYLAHIIDFTLSRMGNDVVYFCDLSSEDDIFRGQGDYQFDIYRKMKEENLNNWADYNPHTNVLWLHYLADKMLNMRYKKRTTKSLKMLKEVFEEFMRDSLENQAAVDLLLKSQLFQQN